MLNTNDEFSAFMHAIRRCSSCHFRFHFSTYSSLNTTMTCLVSRRTLPMLCAALEKKIKKSVSGFLFSTLLFFIFLCWALFCLSFFLLCWKSIYIFCRTHEFFNSSVRSDSWQDEGLFVKCCGRQKRRRSSKEERNDLRDFFLFARLLFQPHSLGSNIENKSLGIKSFRAFLQWQQRTHFV